ncbi:MAG TPA: RDD family protein [Bryobacteraceae bacterium]|nr:RDD family protein [Bryobacteraceae bacterium]
MAVPPMSLDYASWGSRVVGYLIDNLIVLAVAIPIALVAGVLGTGAAAVGSLSRFGGNAFGSSCCCVLLLFPIIQIAFGIYNRIYLVAQRGYSIGQGVAKIKVVDAFGNLLPSSTLWLRLLVQVLLGFVPIVGILDLLWPLWDDRKQTLHDKAVSSYVINWPQAVAMP